MKSKRILIDCDGPLSDLVAGTLAAAGIPDHVPAPEWDFLNNLPAEQKYAAKRLRSKPGFALSLPVVPGAVEAIWHLRRIAEVHILTAPMSSSASWKEDRLEWLSRHFNIGEDMVTFADDKSSTEGATLLDDKPANIETWSARQGRRGWLWSCFHNQGSSWDHRVANWPDAVRVLLAQVG